MRSLYKMVGIIALFFALGLAYLQPGSTALLQGRTDKVLGDDTDISGMVYIYDQVIELAKSHPSWLLYGSVYLSNQDPNGSTYWMPFSERILTILLHPFVQIEQMSTAISLALILLSGLTMYGLARYLRWNFAVSLALSIAWAFTPFARARAKVHVAMTGVYHVPLIFLALLLIARGRTWRSLAAAALALVVSCMTIHYFIVTSLFLTPFFLLFLCLQSETRADWRRVFKRLSIAALPAVAFLGFCFAVPVPPSVELNQAQLFPKSGETPDGSMHPFLTIFAAHPMDYLGGDISLGEGARDLNPLRQMVNGHILSELGNGNAHERTNGIRWSVLLLATIAFVQGLRSPQRRTFGFFLAFGVFGFWLSLAPNVPFYGAGPSGWLYKLVSQVRVPSRAGILFHFALLMAIGYWLSAKAVRNKWILFGLPLLMILDFPPMVQGLPMMDMRPAYAELQRERGACGFGMYFPFVSHYHLNVLHYHFMQQARGTDCGLLNGIQNQELVNPLVERFPPTMEFLSSLDNNLVVRDQLRKLADCVPMSFIAFDEHVPKRWREETCAGLGWKMNPDLTCVSPRKGQPLARLPHTCL